MKCVRNVFVPVEKAREHGVAGDPMFSCADEERAQNERKLD